MSESVRGGAPTISTAELHVALEQALSGYFGTSRRITGFERRPSAYSSSFAIEELEVRLDNGMGLQLIFKNLSRQALLKRARQLKPAFLYDPLREIETYRAILMPNRLSTATCYGAIVDHQAARYGLFLEKVPGLELYQVGDFAAWQQVTRRLATLHARFGSSCTLPAAEKAHLLNYDEDFYRLWIRRSQEALSQAGSARFRPIRHGIEWLAGRYDRVVEQLTALPVTFIHGEFYASNVLVQEGVGDLRVCPVDWEMAAVGPGPMDLAALVAGGWSEEEKAAMAMAYYDALTPINGWPPPPDKFMTALEYCRLHLAVQWLGWFGRRRPFQAHAQDWLGEALRLAEKLGL